MVKAALYARVSRDDLELENQRRILRERAEREGWDYEFFEEKETTRKTRPVKNKLLRRLREHEFDVVVFTKLDRFGRSLTELVMDIQQITDAGVRVLAITQGIDFDKTSNAASRMYLQILAAFAEFERELIRERTLEGLARARAAGVKLGRPRKKKVTPKPRGDLPLTLPPTQETPVSSDSSGVQDSAASPSTEAVSLAPEPEKEVKEGENVG